MNVPSCFQSALPPPTLQAQRAYSANYSGRVSIPQIPQINSANPFGVGGRFIGDAPTYPKNLACQRRIQLNRHLLNLHDFTPLLKTVIFHNYFRFIA